MGLVENLEKLEVLMKGSKRNEQYKFRKRVKWGDLRSIPVNGGPRKGRRVPRVSAWELVDVVGPEAFNEWFDGLCEEYQEIVREVPQLRGTVKQWMAIRGRGRAFYRLRLDG